MRGTKLCLQLCPKFPLHCLWYWRIWFTVDAENLLADGVGPASEDACLGRSRPTFNPEDARDVDTFASEISNEGVSSRIVTDSADRKDVCAESRKIVGGIGAAAWNEMRFAMAEDQNRSFA